MCMILLTKSRTSIFNLRDSQTNIVEKLEIIHLCVRGKVIIIQILPLLLQIDI